MRWQIAVSLGLLGCVSAGCWPDGGFYAYGLANQRNHPLRVTVRSGQGCPSQLDLSDASSFGKAVTKTLEPHEVAELESFASESVGERALDARSSRYPYRVECGAVWLSLPDHDYEAVLAWDESEYSSRSAELWEHALVVEGTKERVRVHVPEGVEELGVPE